MPLSCSPNYNDWYPANWPFELRFDISKFLLLPFRLFPPTLQLFIRSLSNDETVSVAQRILWSQQFLGC